MNDWITWIAIYLTVGILVSGLPEIKHYFKYDVYEWAGWEDYVVIVALFVLGTILWPLALYLNYKYKKKKEPTQEERSI